METEKTARRAGFETTGADSELGFEHVEFEVPVEDTQVEIWLRQLDILVWEKEV